MAYAIFAGQIDGIGDGGDSDKLEKAGENHVSQAFLLDFGGGMGLKQRHARAWNRQAPAPQKAFLLGWEHPAWAGLTTATASGLPSDAVGRTMVVGDDEVEGRALWLR